MSKKSKSLLSQVYERCTNPNIPPHLFQSNPSTNDDFDDDESFNEISNQILEPDNEIENNITSSNILNSSKIGSHHYFSQSNDLANTIKIQVKHTRGFLSNAFSQSLEGDKININVNTQVIPNKNIIIAQSKHTGGFLSNAFSQSLEVDKIITPVIHNEDILISEKNKLQDEVYMVKGQLSLLKENQIQSITTRDLKIKHLQDELNKVNVESKKKIESLESQLQFKDANLIAVNQKVASLEHYDTSVDKDSTFNEDFTPTKSKRLKLYKVCPISRNNNFFSSNFYTNESNTDETVNLQTTLNENAINENMMVDGVVEGLKVMNPPVNEVQNLKVISPSANEVHEMSTAIMLKNDTPKDAKPFINFIMKSTDKENYVDMLLIMDQHHEPRSCCTIVDFEKHCQYLSLVINKLTKIIIEEQNIESKEYSIISLEGNKNVNELKYLIKKQIELLVLAMNSRTKGLNNATITRTISNVFSERKNFLINPDYSCCYHHIYPVWESLKKLMYMESKYALVAPEIFAEIVVPSLMSIINKFCYKFCCQTSEIDYDCNGYKNNFEMNFIQFILESFMDVLEFSNGAQSNIIYQELFKSFINLVPVFGATLDLRITALKLFTKMCVYNCNDTIFQHEKDVCFFLIIFDLLKCKCLEGEKAVQLLSQIIDFSKVICESSINRNADCKCIKKLFSLLIYLGQIVTLNISKNNFTVRDMNCLKGILGIFVQLLSTLGESLYSSLTDNSDYKVFIITIRNLPPLTDKGHCYTPLIGYYITVLNFDMN